jgi:hypothetical protein
MNIQYNDQQVNAVYKNTICLAQTRPNTYGYSVNMCRNFNDNGRSTSFISRALDFEIPSKVT